MQGIKEKIMEFIEKIKEALCMNEENNLNTHVIDKSIFREYDIRGIYNETLFNEDMYAIGRAFASLMSKEGIKKIAVGFDCRKSSPDFAENFINGLMDSGAEVVFLGVCHTPMIYYAVLKYSFDAGIMITASHNPAEYNGLKIMKGDMPFSGEEIQKLYKTAAAKDFVDGIGREVILNKIFQNYVSDLLSGFDFSYPLKVAWDIGNGSTSFAIRYLTALLPGKHHLVFEEMDGSFPNRSPDPMAPGSLSVLSNTVVNNDFDIGFAFDSDGDRLAVVNRKGELLYSDQVLTVLASEFLRKNPAAQVIGDIKFSDTLFSTIKKCGGIPLIEKAGHSYIKQRMKSTNALLAGEMSGHFFFKDRWFGFDDGIYAALRVLEILEANPQVFDNLPRPFITPEIRIECDDHFKFEIINSIKQRLQSEGIEFIDLDGIRVNKDEGWWLLRASNTQNVLSLRVEAHTLGALKRLKANVISYIEDYIPDVEEIIDVTLERYELNS